MLEHGHCEVEKDQVQSLLVEERQLIRVLDKLSFRELVICDVVLRRRDIDHAWVVVTRSWSMRVSLV